MSRKRLPIRGGNWNNTSNAGVFYLNLNNHRSNSNTNIGSRAALVLLPEVNNLLVIFQCVRKKGLISLPACTSRQKTELPERQLVGLRKVPRSAFKNERVVLRKGLGTYTPRFMTLKIYIKHTMRQGKARDSKVKCWILVITWKKI